MQDKEVMRLRSRLYKSGFSNISIVCISFYPKVYSVSCSYCGHYYSKDIPYSELRYYPTKIVKYVL